MLSDPERRRQHDDWIARTEARQGEPKAKPKAAEPSRKWNGKERRRRAWSTGNSSATSFDSGGRLKRSGTAIALWTSVAVVGTMLFLLYHA